jgi:hypothetical protein
MDDTVSDIVAHIELDLANAKRRLEALHASLRRSSRAQVGLVLFQISGALRASQELQSWLAFDDMDAVLDYGYPADTTEAG